MTHPHLSRASRRTLLGGVSALIIATALLPSSASAQAQTASSTGSVTVTTNQDSQDAGVSALILTPPTLVRTDPMVGTTLHVDGNRVSANATANAADAELDLAISETFPAGGLTTIHARTIEAQAPALIVGRQAVQHATVSSEANRSASDLATGVLDRSQIAVAGNAERGTAGGNDHSASLRTDGNGGSIALLQTVDSSSVMSQQSGTATLRAGAVSNSSVAFTGNERSAAAIANSSLANLVASGSVSLGGAESLRTHVGADGLATAGAAAVVAQSQMVTSTTTARVGNGLPSGDLIQVASVMDGSLTADRNSLGASGTGNRAAATMAIDAPSVQGPGGVGAALTVQQLDGQVQSSVLGTETVHVVGTTTRSALSAAGNVVRSAATGNTADTAVVVNAGVLDTTVPAGVGLPPRGPVGTAVVTDDGDRATSAAIAVHHDQRVGETSISASTARSGVSFEFDGPVVSSEIEASGNQQAAQALGNESSAALDIAAPAFASSANVLVSQTSDAGIGAFAGQTGSPGEAIISLGSPLYGSQLSIKENALQSLAVGNRSDAALSLEAASVTDGGAHVVSRAGSLGEGYGAAATLALASVQSVGKDGAQPMITSQSFGTLGVNSASAVSRGLIAAEDNLQSAVAIANSGSNSLSLASTADDGASTALSSSQFGAAKVAASSAMQISAPAFTELSTARINGNANQASASVNDVVNRLSTGGLSPVSLPASVSADTVGGANAQGLNVLESEQFAMGTVAATATTTLAGAPDIPDAPAGLVGSRFSATGNSTTAEASGNRADNAGVFETFGDGLVSSQMNTASVASTAQSSSFLGTPTPGPGLANARIEVSDNRTESLARGNLVQNSISVSGPRTVGDAVTALTGRFNASSIAPVALVSAQSNYGSIAASAGSAVSVPLNQTGFPVRQTEAALNGNTTQATAYANGASNMITVPSGQVTGVALVSSQYNYGSVQARVTAAPVTFNAGDVRNSSLSLSGNAVTAAATGNIATNVIGSMH